MLYRFISDFNYTSIIRSFLQLRYWYIAEAKPKVLQFNTKSTPRPIYRLNNKYIDISPYVNESMLILLDRIGDPRYSKQAWRDDIKDILRCINWWWALNEE